MNDYDLVDMYITLHSNTRKYSWRRFNGMQRSRLYFFFLVSEQLGLDIASADTMPGYCSDHSLVSFVMLSKQVLSKGTAHSGNSAIHFFETQSL